LGKKPRVNCLWRLAFGQASPLISTGNRSGKLELSDLWGFDDYPEAVAEQINALWAQERLRPKPALWKALVQLTKGLVKSALALNLLGAIMQLCAPLLLNQIIKAVEWRHGQCDGDRSELGWQSYLCDQGAGYGLVACLAVCNAIKAFSSGWGQLMLMRVAIKVRGGLLGVIFQKALRLSPVGMSQTGAGVINNLAANDAEQLLQSTPILGQLIGAPLLLVGSLVGLAMAVGPSFLGGFAAMILVLCSCLTVLSKFMKLKTKQLKLSDGRIGLTNEMLAGIRIVKAYGWEAPLEQEVMKVRSSETGLLALQQLLIAVLVVVIQCAPAVLGVVTFSIYAASGNEMTPSTIFTALALLNVIRVPMAFAPFAFFTLLKILVSVRRVQGLLEADESDGVLALTDGASSPPAGPIALCKEDGNAIVPVVLPSLIIKNAEFGYPLADKTVVDGKGKGKGKGKGTGKGKGCGCFGRKKRQIKGQDDAEDEQKEEEVDPASLIEIKREGGKVLKVRRALTVEHLEPMVGGLTMVVGPVGSGKSSLLAAWLGEAAVLQGSSCSAAGQLAYASQQPWIMNATLEQNVKFAAQRQDDDDKYYQKVLNACSIVEDLKAMPAGDQTEIGERGINLSGGQRARVSVARAIYSSKRVYLFDDPLSAVDAHVAKHLFEQVFGPEGLLAGSTRVLVTHQVQFLHKADQIVVIEGGRITAMGTYASLNAAGSLNGLGSWAEGQSGDAATQQADMGAAIEAAKPTAPLPVDKSRGSLITVESKSVGVVRGQTYREFIMKGWGLDLLCVILFAFSMVCGMRLATDFWLAMWTDPSRSFGLSLGEQIGIYVGLLCGFAIVTYLRAVTLNCFALVRMCRRTYKRLLRSVFGSPVRFFDVTPIGQVLNRFTADMDIIDNQISNVMGQWVGCCEGILVIFIGTCINDPLVLVSSVPCLFVFILVTNHARIANRDVQRLEALTKTPIFNCISETLNGLSTVRAYGYQRVISASMFTAVDSNQGCCWLKALVQSWLTLRLELTSILVGSTCALVPQLPFRFDHASASFLGLALVYSLDLSIYVQAAVKGLTDLEQKFTSVERVFEYCALPQEAAAVLPKDAELAKVHGAWPVSGSLEFSDVTMRYRPELEPALNGLSFSIEAGKKLGVVGRTGSGKSSVIVSLLRLTEIEAGQVRIDGQDLKGVGLRTLRRSIAMIPQEPVLFGKTTLRYNLDPLGEHSEEALEQVLKEVRMDDREVLSDGLRTELQEGGNSFSVGQRQLLCMARAVLRKSKIVLLDEATASVDNVTDEAIQQTIRKVFASSTVLCIAHRIRTIIDSDMVLVMGQGRCIEIGTPKELLATKSSSFRSLAIESKIEVPEE